MELSEFAPLNWQHQYNIENLVNMVLRDAREEEK